jgi:hypothetical protein
LSSDTTPRTLMPRPHRDTVISGLRRQLTWVYFWRELGMYRRALVRSSCVMVLVAVSVGRGARDGPAPGPEQARHEWLAVADARGQARYRLRFGVPLRIDGSARAFPYSWASRESRSRRISRRGLRHGLRY